MLSSAVLCCAVLSLSDLFLVVCRLLFVFGLCLAYNKDGAEKIPQDKNSLLFVSKKYQDQDQDQDQDQREGKMTDIFKTLKTIALVQHSYKVSDTRPFCPSDFFLD